MGQGEWVSQLCLMLAGSWAGQGRAGQGTEGHGKWKAWKVEGGRCDRAFVVHVTSGLKASDGGSKRRCCPARPERSLRIIARSIKYHIHLFYYSYSLITSHPHIPTYYYYYYFITTTPNTQPPPHYSNSVYIPPPSSYTPALVSSISIAPSLVAARALWP